MMSGGVLGVVIASQVEDKGYEFSTPFPLSLVPINTFVNRSIRFTPFS